MKKQMQLLKKKINKNTWLNKKSAEGFESMSYICKCSILSSIKQKGTYFPI